MHNAGPAQAEAGTRNYRQKPTGVQAGRAQGGSKVRQTFASSSLVKPLLGPSERPPPPGVGGFFTVMSDNIFCPSLLFF